MPDRSGAGRKRCRAEEGSAYGGGLAEVGRLSDDEAESVDRPTEELAEASVRPRKPEKPESPASTVGVVSAVSDREGPGAPGECRPTGGVVSTSPIGKDLEAQDRGRNSVKDPLHREGGKIRPGRGGHRSEHQRRDQRREKG